MKHKGQQFQYQDLLEQDLLRTHRRLLREHLNRYGRISLPLLYSAIANSPAQRFYTSEEQATRNINALIRGKPLANQYPLRKEMYLEIYSRVLQKQHLYPHLSIPQLVEIVCAEPAPKFYMTPRSIENKLCQLKKKHPRR